MYLKILYFDRFFRDFKNSQNFRNCLKKKNIFNLFHKTKKNNEYME